MTRKRIALTTLVLLPLLLLAAVFSVRAAFYGTPQLTTEPADPSPMPAGAAQRLAASIRIRTVSKEGQAGADGAAFRALHEHLRVSFPHAHAAVQREIVNGHSLLYTWPGRDRRLKPILLMGHMDVVPVEPGTERNWTHPPFAGHIDAEHVWGRGSLDNKSAVLGTLEAVEMLLREGFRPARTVYLAFGHDEEVGGKAGAREIAALLERRGIRLEMVLDEGGVVGEGLLPGVSAPVALIGIAEKGFLSLELGTQTAGGHSSMPPEQSAVGILSAAIARLEAHPMPARLEGPTRRMFDHLAPELSAAQRAVFANLWLTRPLVTTKLQSSPTTNAMVRTTAAATIFQAGTKDNVLPSRARAVVNFRILPGDTVRSVIEHVRHAVDDPRVTIRRAGAFSAEPVTVSSTQSESYRALERTIRSIHREAVVAPYLVVVVTDSRYFAPLSENVYRFLPLRLTHDDLERVHGSDERISIRSYGEAIRTYRQLILNVAG
jgi:carboxypeptidase PM20D1